MACPHGFLLLLHRPLLGVKEEALGHTDAAAVAGVAIPKILALRPAGPGHPLYRCRLPFPRPPVLFWTGAGCSPQPGHRRRAAEPASVVS